LNVSKPKGTDILSLIVIGNNTMHPISVPNSSVA
jgi:hypothetical protein